MYIGDDVVDVFDADGKFLGEVQLPDQMRTERAWSVFGPRPFIIKNMCGNKIATHISSKPKIMMLIRRVRDIFCFQKLHEKSIKFCV